MIGRCSSCVLTDRQRSAVPRVGTGHPTGQFGRKDPDRSQFISNGGLRKALTPLAVFLLSLLLQGSPSSVSAHDDPGYSHDATTGETNPDWMGKLPDTVRLSNLSIPGTHDTGARVGGAQVEAQTMGIATQLNAGIRAFDVRLGRTNLTSPPGCANLDNDFRIIHGSLPGLQFCQPETFSQLLTIVETFLSQHPREAVLMRIKHETDLPEKDEFARIVNLRLQALGSQRIYGGPTTNPTLGQIRGKIVVLANYGTSSVPAWPGSIPWGDLDLQDAYSLSSTWDLAPKWNNSGGDSKCDPEGSTPNSCANVVFQFRKANQVSCDPRTSESCGGDTLYGNFLSAAVAFGTYPYFFASGHSNPATGAPRLATGATRGVINTCSSNLKCLPEIYYPQTDCFLGTCTVPFEGLNTLTMRYINNSEDSAEYGWLWRTGIVFADFPGKGLISAIIAVNTRRFNHGQHDVGVIPATASGCPNPEHLVTIRMDDEDRNNNNSIGGWIGGFTQDSAGTTFRFCRVDGSRFQPMAGAGIGNRNYAVLRLGDRCPPGSVEFTRGFDNENEDNRNFIVGDAWPNSQTPDTELHFCLFQPALEGANPSLGSFPSFANLPYGYGVFAPADFLGETPDSNVSGFIRTDDEDASGSNKNFLVVPVGAEADIAQILSAGENTRLNVRRVTFTGAECANLPPFSRCDEGDLCTSGECLAGLCIISAVSCPDTPPDQCRAAGVCDPTTGGCIYPPMPDGSTCDDGDPCTLQDECRSGACAGTPVCPAPDGCHLVATCNPDTLECDEAPAVPDGTLCEDGDPCTFGDTCVAGACTSNAVVCPGQDQCRTSTCNSTTGTCSEPTNQPNFIPCDDGDPCTTGDECIAGVCSGSAVVCAAQDQCHVAGVCDPGNGLCSNPAAPDGSACDDGDSCTTNDQCTGGTCSGSPACTATPTITPSPTATQGSSGTPSPEPPLCPGDCNRNQVVVVDEVVLGVDIALGSASVTECTAADGDGSQTVTIDELVAAVNSELYSCPP